MKNVHYAGFWIRFVGYMIDTIILMIVVSIISMIMGVITGLSVVGVGMTMGADLENLKVISAVLGGLLGGIFGLIASWLYFALQYSSRFQATVGMRCVGIQVVDYDYQRLSFGRATGRFFAKYLSGIILMIGYIMIAFTEKKQGLHDFIASTYVVYKE